MDICILLVITSPPAVSSTVGAAIVICGAIAAETTAYAPTAATGNSHQHRRGTSLHVN